MTDPVDDSIDDLVFDPIDEPQPQPQQADAKADVMSQPNQPQYPTQQPPQYPTQQQPGYWQAPPQQLQQPNWPPPGAPPQSIPQPAPVPQNSGVMSLEEAKRILDAQKASQANNTGNNIRTALVVVLCVAVLFLAYQQFIGGGGDRKNDGSPDPAPVVSDQAAYDAGTTYALLNLRGMAELYSDASKKIGDGEIKDIKDLEDFIMAGKVVIADEATKKLAAELERINGEKWTTGNPKVFTKAVSDGFQEVFDAATEGMK